ncbi:MAG: VCBS repeat-containing protein, partial [Candidatus Acidiferrales bacterium]
MNRRAFLKNLSGLGTTAAFAATVPLQFSQLANSWSLAAATPQQQTAQPAFNLVDVTTSAGIHFHHNSGAYGGKLLPETLGSGCAFLDYDNDGWQDILLINGTDWPGHKRSPSTLRLYQNNRNGTFTDVTRRAGLEIEMYGMGVAVGDYNNDGFP